MAKDKLIEKDRMRFKKDSLSGGLALVGLLFGVFYFVGLYQLNDNYYYSILLGGSVIFNLIFMLLSFLSSEEIKNYNRKFSYVLLVLGILQIVRIFYFPALAAAQNQPAADGVPAQIVMPTSRHVWLTIFLICSAAAFLTAGITGFIRSSIIAQYRKDLANGTIVLEKVTSEALVTEPTREEKAEAARAEITDVTETEVAAGLTIPRNNEIVAGKEMISNDEEEK